MGEARCVTGNYFDPTETSIICEIEYSISPRTDSLSLVYPFYLDAI